MGGEEKFKKNVKDGSVVGELKFGGTEMSRVGKKVSLVINEVMTRMPALAGDLNRQQKWCTETCFRHIKSTTH